MRRNAHYNSSNVNKVGAFIELVHQKTIFTSHMTTGSGLCSATLSILSPLSLSVSLYCLSELLCKLLPQSPFSLQTFLSCHNRITTSVTDNIYAGCTPLDLFPVRGKVIHNTAEPSFVTLMTPGLFLL